MQASMVEVKGLRKKYKKFSLGPLDLVVPQGIVVGIVGANGSGKSTLFRLLMNIAKKDAGQVRLFGKDSYENEAEWKATVGYSGELLGAYDFLTIKDIKHLISRWYPTWSEERFIQLVERYRIDLDEKYGKSSKGTKKKVDFVFSLSHDPALLLLDEPTSGVDIVSQRKMKEDLIRFLEDGNRSILLATHAIDEVNQLCDEIIVLDSGRIVHSFNKDEIFENWARVWTSAVPENMKHYRNVLHFELAPPQIVTNDVKALEDFLRKEKVMINHIQRLSMDEVLEYIIDY